LATSGVLATLVVGGVAVAANKKDVVIDSYFKFIL